MSHPLDIPTPEQEAANAAFVWLREMQNELAEIARKEPAHGNDTFGKIQRAFVRYENAYRRATDADRIAKADLRGFAPKPSKG